MTDQTPLGASPIDKAIDTLHEMICQRKYKICEKKENCFIGVNSDKKAYWKFCWHKNRIVYVKRITYF